VVAVFNIGGYVGVGGCCGVGLMGMVRRIDLLGKGARGVNGA